MSGDMAALEPIVEGARALEREGVDVIVGACGSFANFQLEVAHAVSIPVFMSILLEVPLLLRALPQRQKLGIIFATRRSFTERVRTQCEIHDASRIVTLGAEDIPAFQPILAQQDSLDDKALEAGLVDLALAATQKHSDLGMWLLQCSDLPPYAAAVQKATGLPVFDMVTMIDHIYAALNRRGFER
jgi:Asp/Glu/hydantoin racemase